MTRHVLKFDQEDEFVVIGISCHERDYRLCWRLNKAFRLALERCDPDEMNKDLGSTYSYFQEDDQIAYTLIANRNDEGWLIPEHRQVDYFLTMDDPHQKPVNEMLEDIRGLSNVLAAYELDTESTKEKLRLS